MMEPRFTRRQALASSLAAGLVTCPALLRGQTPAAAASQPFRYSLNASTIRAADMPIDKVFQLVADAGYDGIEPWVRDVRSYQQQRGSLNDLRNRAADLGLEVVNMIGFAQWAVEDDARRAKGLEEMKRDMELAESIGCRRIAAPPAGATRQSLELSQVAQRYRTLLDIGQSIGVIPQLELWGASQTLSRLGELAYVAAEAGHASTRVLPDVYHIYKGGSDFAGLRVFSGAAIDVFHLNDYPAVPPRDQISDADRVFPGDGIAPLRDILRTLRVTGFHGFLSLELFNREYWKRDPADVAREGLTKMKASVQAALA